MIDLESYLITKYLETRSIYKISVLDLSIPIFHRSLSLYLSCYFSFSFPIQFWVFFSLFCLSSFQSHYYDVVQQSPSIYGYWEGSKPEDFSLIDVMFDM